MARGGFIPLAKIITYVCRFYLAYGFQIGGLDTESTGTAQEGKADIYFKKEALGPLFLVLIDGPD